MQKSHEIRPEHVQHECPALLAGECPNEEAYCGLLTLALLMAPAFVLAGLLGTGLGLQLAGSICLLVHGGIDRALALRRTHKQRRDIIRALHRCCRQERSVHDHDRLLMRIKTIRYSFAVIVRLTTCVTPGTILLTAGVLALGAPHRWAPPTEESLGVIIVWGIFVISWLKILERRLGKVLESMHGEILI